MDGHNELFIVVFDRIDTAERVLRELQAMVQHKALVLEDAAVIRKSEKGRVSILQTKDWSEGEAGLGGGVVGLLIGTALGGPIGGVLFGVGLGALYARLTDLGIKDDLMREFGTHMQPGCGAVAILTTPAEAEKAAAKLCEYGGKLLNHTLTPEAYDTLAEALRSGEPAPEGEIKGVWGESD